MKKYSAFIGLLLLINTQAYAEQYAIHLDTSETSDIRDYEALSIYGELYTVEATEGLTSTLLGPYETKRLAGEALNKIRENGNFAAFIRKHKSQNSRITATKKHESKNDVTFKDLTENQVISRL